MKLILAIQRSREYDRNLLYYGFIGTLEKRKNDTGSTTGYVLAGRETNREELHATEFRSNCLRLMNEVSMAKKEVIVTKRGKPVERLNQYREKPVSLFGSAKYENKVLCDIVTPIDDMDWVAESRNPDRKP